MWSHTQHNRLHGRSERREGENSQGRPRLLQLYQTPPHTTPPPAVREGKCPCPHGNPGLIVLLLLLESRFSALAEMP